MRDFTCLSIFIILSALAAIIMIVAGFICQYKNKTDIKNTTYECGIAPFGDAHVKFDVKYFNYAILFLIFDIETIFFYPFAVSLDFLGLYAVIESFLFLLILFLGLYFVIKKDLLRWLE
ncbi:NADH-quinone oxidoreductase subunit A [bacterium]|nr:NADH-quinone oxidoreductase subunit A [bacterium]